MKKYSSFIALLIITAIWGFAHGGINFVMKDITIRSFDLTDTALLASITAAISFGSMSAYIFGGLVSKIFTERVVVVTTLALGMVAYLLFYLFFPESYIGLMSVSFFFGFLYGIFVIARGVMIYLEIRSSHLPENMINGLVSVVLLLSLILGAYFGNKLFELVGPHSFWVFMVVMLVGIVMSYFVQSEKKVTKPTLPALRSSYAHDITLLYRRYRALITASSILWSVATVICIESVPFAVERFGIRESSASLLFLYSAVGALIGNAISLRVKRRWFVFRLATYAFAVLVTCFVIFITSYASLVMYSIVAGVLMGITTNLVDSYYVKSIGDANVKEQGGAMTGIVLNGMSGVLLTIAPYISIYVLFVIMGALLALAGLTTSNRTYREVTLLVPETVV